MGEGHGTAQRGWRRTDEDIAYWFIKALRQGDSDRALELAPAEEGMAGWPELKRREWSAWIQLAHLMKGQRDYEGEERSKLGRGSRDAGIPGEGQPEPPPEPDGAGACVQRPPATDLVLNCSLDHRNVLLAQGTRGERVGYLLADGGRRFVPWLGFIERAKARAMKAGRPVRLVGITRIGRADGRPPEWRDLPADSFVHGCLTPRGAHAVYEEGVCVVGARRKAR